MKDEDVDYSIDYFEIGRDKTGRISRNLRTVTFEQQDEIIGDPPSIEARQVNLFIDSQLMLLNNNLKINI